MNRRSPRMLLCIALSTVLLCTINTVLLYCTVLYCTALYCTIPYDSTVLLHCTYCTILHCILYSASRAGLVLVAEVGVNNSRAPTKIVLVTLARLCILESVPWDHVQHANAYHKGRNFECNWTDGGRHSWPCLMRGAQRDSIGSTGRTQSYSCWRCKYVQT